MLNIHVNIIAVIVSTVVVMIVGSLWYSPKVFGNAWMVLIGKKMSDLKASSMLYIYTIILAFVLSYAVASIVSITNTNSILGGLEVGFGLWFGFVLTTGGPSYLFEGRPFKLFVINYGQTLATFLLSGLIMVLIK